MPRVRTRIAAMGLGIAFAIGANLPISAQAPVPVRKSPPPGSTQPPNAPAAPQRTAPSPTTVKATSCTARGHYLGLAVANAGAPEVAGAVCAFDSQRNYYAISVYGDLIDAITPPARWNSSVTSFTCTNPTGLRRTPYWSDHDPVYWGWDNPVPQDKGEGLPAVASGHYQLTEHMAGREDVTFTDDGTIFDEHRGHETVVCVITNLLFKNLPAIDKSRSLAPSFYLSITMDSCAFWGAKGLC
jgi:hypothetical protein